jgi:hypothetical protein
MDTRLGFAATFQRATKLVRGAYLSNGDAMHRREKAPEPAHNVLLLLGMAAVSWAAIGLAGMALWPRQPQVQSIASEPLVAQDYPRPPEASHGHHSAVAVADTGKRRQTAKQAVRKTRVAIKRRKGPSFAARVFAASIN